MTRIVRLRNPLTTSHIFFDMGLTYGIKNLMFDVGTMMGIEYEMPSLFVLVIISPTCKYFVFPFLNLGVGDGL